MGLLDKAKAAAEQAAHRANETVTEVQAKRELTKAYAELGETACRLADSGAISHPELQSQVAHIHELQRKHDTDGGGGAGASPTETVEQPLSGAGPGAA
jgi:hypothetical protein